MSDPHDLVSIYQGANTIEAHLVKNLLLDEGIEAVVSEENEPLVGLAMAQSRCVGGGQGRVRARDVIRQYEETLIARAERPYSTCPSCQATVIRGALGTSATSVTPPGQGPKSIRGRMPKKTKAKSKLPLQHDATLQSFAFQHHDQPRR